MSTKATTKKMAATPIEVASPKKAAKKAAPVTLKAVTTASASTPATKPVQHNKKFPVQKVSRTEMVKVINSTKGRFFTTSHINADGNIRTMNCIKSNRPATELGYILVYSVQDKEYRNINPRTLMDVSFGGVHYKANSKPKAGK